MPRAIPIRMLTAVYCGLVETKSDDEVEKKINNVDYDIFNSSFSVSLYAHWRCILNRWKSKSRARFFLTGLAARPSLYSVQGKVINF